MTGRKQEFNIQIYQILDALLLACAFFGAYFLRNHSANWFALDPVAPFSENQWMVFIIMPFGPIFLELQGFYSHPLQKTITSSLGQMVGAAFWLALLIGGCVVFFRLQVPSRAVVPLFGVLATLLLVLRERSAVAYFRNRNHAAG